jgi:hypothetical protein
MPHQYSTRVQTVPVTSHADPNLSPNWKTTGFSTGRDGSTMSTQQLTAETRIYDTYPYDASQGELPCGFSLVFDIPSLLNFILDPPEQAGAEGMPPASASQNLGGAYPYGTPGAYAYVASIFSSHVPLRPCSIR